MYPPSQGLTLDIEALSGIMGSISIACWVVVFSPQIIENFQRSSAEGLSIQFIVVWLLGDVFNILGAVLQGVLPTMIILAIYYTIADMVLLGQLFYYRGFTLSDRPREDNAVVGADADADAGLNERSALLAADEGGNQSARRRSRSSAVSVSHLSPATPLHPAPKSTVPPAVAQLKPRSTTQSILFNLTAIIAVCIAGILGWWLSARPSAHHRHEYNNRLVDDDHNAALQFNTLGQVFGYICAALYLGSRIPQLLLNYRRKSTDGVSMLFFLFACIGNLTYVLSICAYEPACANSGGRHRDVCEPGQFAADYERYIVVNMSWLLGSAGTLLLDVGVFVQYFMYRVENVDARAGSVDAAHDDVPRAESGEGRGRSPNER